VLARDGRMRGVLSNRGQILLARNAAMWLYEVESGELDSSEVFRRYASALAFSVPITQGVSPNRPKRQGSPAPSQE
jgi:hypothetical protein